MAIRILLGDSSDLLLLGAQAVLEDDHRFAVVGTARAFHELLALAQQSPPDVIVFEEWIYNVETLVAVQTLRQHVPQAYLIVLGDQAKGLVIRDLLDAGLRGYLYKSDDLRECLPRAVDVVLRGRPYLSPTAGSEYLVSMQSPLRDWRLDDEARAVLRLLAKGHTASDIAKRLGKPLRRVYWVRQKLRKRFGAATNEHLIQRAGEEGFVLTR